MFRSLGCRFADRAMSGLAGSPRTRSLVLAAEVAPLPVRIAASGRDWPIGIRLFDLAAGPLPDGGARAAPARRGGPAMPQNQRIADGPNGRKRSNWPNGTLDISSVNGGSIRKPRPRR
jgi:hypothetical protein